MPRWRSLLDRARPVDDGAGFGHASPSAAGDEDVHTAIERRVTEFAGDVGAKLHTGRSRNDQVATDLRLWCRRELLVDVADEVDGAAGHAAARRAREAGDVYLPGYTHLQRAQPVLLAHHLLAHGWALARDVDRMLAHGGPAERVAARAPAPWPARRCRSTPTSWRRSSGSGAGSRTRSTPSRTATSWPRRSSTSRSVGVHLSRLGEEIVCGRPRSSASCTLDDAYATGSSMLPQKKNPDVAELARGKVGRLDRPSERRAHHAQGPAPGVQPRSPGGQGASLRRGRRRSCGPCAAMTRACSRRRTWNAGRMQAAADGPRSRRSTWPRWLVERGMPFRQAHALVGGSRARRRSNATCRSSSWWRPIPTWATRPWPCSSRASR